ncbi:MAG: hypothetical protein ACLP2X_04935 [Syntrophobacteraceae bacterium]
MNVKAVWTRNTGFMSQPSLSLPYTIVVISAYMPKNTLKSYRPMWFTVVMLPFFASAAVPASRQVTVHGTDCNIVCPVSGTTDRTSWL